MAEEHSPETILQEALELSDLHARAAYLDEMCGDNEALRAEMESLLAAHFAADAFMDTLADPVWQEAPTEKEGDAIGRYKLLQQIGEGGFGTVYMAEQTKPVKRRVALKVIKAGMDTKEVIARFEAERQALALMDHPNIAQVHDAGTTEGGRPYFVMELVKGVPLTKYCSDKDLDTVARLNLFTDVCAAVQHAHQKGIIHRDLKPSNIMVSPHDGKPVVKVIDFGIAKAIGMELTEKTVFTQLGRMIGTPQYMSPEQAELNALDVDTRSDIYSLGVVLYELLTGTTPLDGTKLRSAAYDEMQRMIREETPVKPSTRVSTSRTGQTGPTSPTPDPRALRGDLDWIVLKALEKERVRRYETANGLAADIVRHLRDEPVSAGPPSASYRLRKFVRRNRRGLLSGAAAAMALLVGLSAAGGLWLKEKQRVLRVEQNAGDLVAEAEQLMEENEQSDDFEDDASFRRASQLSLRAEDLLTRSGNADREVQARSERLVASVASEERARALVDAIEEGLMKEMSKFGKEERDNRGKVDALSMAFADFELRPLDKPVEDTVATITECREPLQDLILVGLVAWADALEKTEPEQAARLEEVIEAADSDPWRKSLRAAIKAEDAGALEALTASPEMGEQPTMAVLQLSTALEKEQLAGAVEKLLRRAQQEAPTSFWTNFQLGSVLAGAIDREEGRDVRDKFLYGGGFNIGEALPGLERDPNPVRPEFDEAIGFLRAAVTARPDAGMAWMILGGALSGGGHLDEALATHLRTATLYPEAPHLDLLIGSALAALKRPEEALPYLQRAAEQEADSPSPFLPCQIGMILAELGRYEEARESLMKAVKLSTEAVESGDPDNALELSGAFGEKIDEAMVYVLIGMSQEKPEAALASFELALQANPEHAGALVARGAALMETGREEDLAEATRSLRRALEVAPEWADAHNSCGAVLMAQQKFEEALPKFRRALELEPNDAGALSNLGASLVGLGRFEEAKPPLRKALELSPGYAMAWNNLGVYHDRQGENEAALECFQKALSFDPKDRLAQRNLARILFDLGRIEESIAAYRILNDSASYFSLGNLLVEKEMSAEAIDAFERAVALEPKFVKGHDNLGAMYMVEDRYEDALQSFRTAIGIAPHYAQAHSNLGFLLGLRGDFDNAVDSLLEAVELDATEEKYQNNLQAALFFAGRIAGMHLMHGNCGSPLCQFDLLQELEEGLLERIEEGVPYAPAIQAKLWSLSNASARVKLLTIFRPPPSPEELKTIWENRRGEVGRLLGSAEVQFIVIRKDDGEARIEAGKLRREVRNGTDFGELASAHPGGSAMEVGLDDVNEILTEAAFYVPVGETSEVLEDRNACYLLKVEAREAGSAEAFEDPGVKEAVEYLFRHGRRKVWEERHLDKVQDRDADLVMARVQNLVGLLRFTKGDYEGARVLIEKALRIQEAALGPDDPATLMTKHNIAMGYRNSGMLKEALPLAREAFEGRKAKLGLEDPATLVSMDNLAMVYLAMKQPELARPLAEMALEGWEKAAGNPLPKFVLIRNLAAICHSQGDLDRAVALLEGAVTTMREEFGPGYPELLEHLRWLAGLHNEAGKSAKAIPLLEEIVTSRKGKAALDEAETFQIMSSLAFTYTSAGNLGKAVRTWKEVVAWRTKNLGPHDPKTLLSRNNLAAAYANAKDFEKAIPHMEEVRRRWEESPDANREATLQAEIQLAVIYREAGRGEEALPLLEEVRRTAENGVIEFNAGVALLVTYDKMEKPDEQLKSLAEEVISMAQEMSGKDELRHAGILVQLGVESLEFEAFRAAELVLRSSVEIRKKALPPESWYHFSAKSRLGAALLGQKRFEEAEPLLEGGYQGMMERIGQIPPEGRIAVPTALNSLISFYETREAEGDVEKAAAYRAELEEIAENDKSEE